MSFLYSLLLKLFYPTSVSILLLFAAAVLWRFKHQRPARISFWAALGVLLICGNGWVVRALTKHLEWQYPPLTSQRSVVNSQVLAVSIAEQGEFASAPGPQADVILVLSGGVRPHIAPRPTVEIGDAGDRLLYGAHLFRQHKAPQIICTGNVTTGGFALRPIAAEMAEFLGLLGIPTNSIMTENRSENTREHAKYLYPLLQQHGFKRVLLVTSAMHMPRSMAVFKKLCPGIEFIAAPTDFHVVERLPMAWYGHLVSLIPTPESLFDFSEAMHEYLGIAYYKLRGWL